jgi:hypothetical protein
MVGGGQIPRDDWPTTVGDRETISLIIVIAGDCGHLWHAMIGTDERRVLFYMPRLQPHGLGGFSFQSAGHE